MRRPWMPFYFSDFQRDTAHLSLAEKGAYINLLDWCWSNGALPSQCDRIARIAGMTEKEWELSGETLRAFFRSDGTQKRIEQEMARIKGISESASKAARMRWHSERNADALRTQCYSHSDSYKKEEDIYPSRANARSKKSKVPLPNDFSPDREVGRGLGWSEDRISQQIEAFKDSARAHQRVYADWGAAWRNWCRSPLQQKVNERVTVQEAARNLHENVVRRMQDFAGTREPEGASVVRLLSQRPSGGS